MALVSYMYYFKYILLGILMGLLAFVHKGHASGALVPICMWTDCKHVELIQTKVQLDLPIYVLSFFFNYSNSVL